MANPYRFLYRRSVRFRRLVRRAKNALILGAIRSSLAYVDRRSLADALRLGERLGGWAFRLLRKPRRLALEHLDVAFGGRLPPSARERLARASFVNAALSFCELAKIDAIREQHKTYFEVQGQENVEALLAAGRGAVIVTGHIGNWELLAAYWAWLGLPVAAIARRVEDGEINQVLVDLRARQGVATILRESPAAAREILRALKQNALLAILIDQDTRVQSVSLPFFGRAARTPIAAASLAIRRDLPVATVFIQRRPQGGHRISVGKPIVIPRSDDVAEDIRALTKVFNDQIEAQIERNPAEWVWWHRRWRRSPQPELDLDG